MGINVNSNKATHCGVVTVHRAEKAASGNCFVREHQVFHLLEIIIHLNLLSWVYVQVSVVNFLSISLIFFHWVFRKISLYLVEENREAPLVALPTPTTEDAAPESWISKTELCAIFMVCLISQGVLGVLQVTRTWHVLVSAGLVWKAAAFSRAGGWMAWGDLTVQSQQNTVPVCCCCL